MTKNMAQWLIIPIFRQNIDLNKSKKVRIDEERLEQAETCFNLFGMAHL